MSKALNAADFGTPPAPPASRAPRVDPEESRDTDYAMRAADGVNVKRCDPDKHYVLVAKSSHQLATYRALGYQKVPRTADGPYIFADDDDDALGSSHVEYMDSVLMVILKAKRQRIEQYGHATGAQGQKAYDEIEKQIVRDGGMDLMRGKMPRGTALITETSALTRES